MAGPGTTMHQLTVMHPGPNGRTMHVAMEVRAGSFTPMCNYFVDWPFGVSTAVRIQDYEPRPGRPTCEKCARSTTKWVNRMVDLAEVVEVAVYQQRQPIGGGAR